jgi:putative tricarboxylic transport membrane protein
VTIDRILGVLFVLIAAGAAWHAQTLVVPFAADPVGPSAFPTIVAAILGISGIVLLLRPGEVILEFGRWPRAIVLIAASLAYPLLLHPLGFVPATTLLCFAAALAFEARPLPGLISSIITAAVFFALIDYLLDLPLPRGPLGI